MTRYIRILLPMLIVLGACTSQGAGPDAIVKDLFKSLDEGHPEAAWDALPGSYQTDINEIVGLFGENMDKDVYDKGFQVAGKLVSVLESKKSFILGHPMIMGMTEGKITGETYDAIVKTLGTYTKSEISTLDGVKNLDIRSFLSKTGGSAIADMKMLSELSDEKAPFENFQDIQVDLIDQSGDEATISVKAGEEEAEEVKLVKVEDKWVPADMANGWSAGVAETKVKLAELPQQFGEDEKMQAMMGMDMAISALGQLEAAATQDEFNAAIGGIMGMAMGGMGGAPPMDE